MTHGKMYEIFTNYYTNDITKWSGIGQENDFLATIWAQVSQLTFLTYYILIKVGYFSNRS